MPASKEAREFAKWHGTSLQRDWTRVRRLSSLSQNIPGLEATQPLRLEENDAVIVYERLEGLTSFLEGCRRQRDRSRRAGELLARLHRAGSSSTPEARSRATTWLRLFGVDERDVEEIAEASDPGFMLGDCWHGNLFWRGDNTLVILDPIPELPVFEQAPEDAYGAIDAAMLHMSHFFYHGLWANLSLDLIRIYRDQAEEMLQGYSAASGISTSCLKRVSDIASRHYIASYATRLSEPLASIRRHLAHRLAARVYRNQQHD